MGGRCGALTRVFLFDSGIYYFNRFRIGGLILDGVSASFGTFFDRLVEKCRSNYEAGFYVYPVKRDVIRRKN